MTSASTPEPTRPAASTPEQPWPVRVVSQKIGGYIAKLGWVWVDGQLAQISRRPGTVFLTLRDPSAEISLSVTVHPDVLYAAGPDLAEGARVIVHGKPEFYAGRGTLSLRADEIRRVGLGELLARLEKLKKQLAGEGLFDPRRKRRLPFLPQRIGLVTGRASAAERDVLTNARRRWPAVDFRVLTVAVQGPAAVPQVIEALAELDRDPGVDVIIVARGGGSVEDLLPFSDEALCRAVFACTTPVISAIGHETDTPLLDFVADVRASTPTDAAKRAVPDFGEEVRLIDTARARLRRGVRSRLDREQQRLDAVHSRPALARPTVLIDRHLDQVLALRDRTTRVMTHRLERATADLTHTLARLRALSPLATLERGYAVVRHGASREGLGGTVVRDPASVGRGDELRITLAGGELEATVNG